eukprot:CAMPEP_0119408934 /NCGR_PEP_ID=MMETSP1335-20130426/2339_1 /TAXON_ID=259385 /ORGANISM="Chrysoculter rhomboideus, Strain RCC1486" /LENGTH=52 /DNA_ID=CAMNT_0007433227 /DNA_START=77 /DNA_END=235 /DNA_ORIENTATION=-
MAFNVGQSDVLGVAHGQRAGGPLPCAGSDHRSAICCLTTMLRLRRGGLDRGA